MTEIANFVDDDDSGRDALGSRSRSEISKTIDEEKAQALKMLRNPELKPFIIYVRPPPFDVLKETRHQVIVDIGADINNNIVRVLVFKIMFNAIICFVKAYARSTFDETNSRSFTDDEFRDMIQVRRKQNLNDRVCNLST